MCYDHVSCTLDLCLPEEGGCKNADVSCGCIDDDLEDNDTIAQAIALTEGVWSFEPIAVWGDPDVWRIDTVPGARVRANVYASPTPDAPVRVEFFKVSVMIATAEGLPEGGAIDEIIPDREADYLRVRSSLGIPCLPYLLIVSITAPDIPPLECNSLCPSLPCYKAECNAQGSCEYPPDDAGGWREREALVWIPPATVPMGAAGQPVVSVGRGFFIDKYEVSAEEYLRQPRCRQPQANCFDKSSMGTDPEGYRVIWDEVTTRPLVAAHCETGAPGERGSCADHPMTYVRFRDAQRYCAWRGGGLCGEAEWELAAKGSTQQSFPWGDAPKPGEAGWDPPRANCAEDVCADGFERTAPVDAFPEGVSPAGVFGMAGNVAEWVWDHWDASTGDLPADFPLDGTYWRGGVDSVRVVRGAAWRAFDSDTTLMETRHGSGWGLEWIGFRCCHWVSEDSPACECTDDQCP
jgi:formylglycine-generating enzyme required for sulfatase activity